MEKLIDRFLKYVKINTISDPYSETFPSTDHQLEFGKTLVDELTSLGLSDISMDENGYVMAVLPSNTTKNTPVIGFIAHMDTSPDMSGENVKPQIVKSYDGNDIILNKEQNIILKTEDFPEIKEFIGEDIITTDGTTLLGADNKAGIAIIITAMEYFLKNPQIEHGTIKIAFTPDEEVGRGADYFDVKKFGADYAYTMDGGKIGELEYETFNAAKADIMINGINIHPGTAKNKMKNSMRIAMELDSMLPIVEKPEFTEGYEGFFHLHKLSGDVENTKAEYLIRDHDREKFENKKELLQKTVDYLNFKYGEKTITAEIKDNYYNMGEILQSQFHIVEAARKAIEALGIEPIIKPIRGGTDGARLSFMGLPTPNIFTGGMNYHGKYEYIPVNSMSKGVDVILKIIELSVE